MRALVPAAVVAFVLVLAGATAGQAKVSYEPRATALRTVRLGVHYAITLEANALKLSRAGKDAEAKKEIHNALHLLDQVLPSAKRLTPLRNYFQYTPTSAWQDLSSNVREAIALDEQALEQNGFGFRQDLYSAGHHKESVYKLVDDEIRHPMCTELVNLQQITVAGVPGNPQLSVDVACNQPEQEFIVVVPTSVVTKLAPDGKATSAVLLAADVIKVDLGGATSGGATMELQQNPPADAPVDSTVVPIAGDSHAEYIYDVM